MQQNPTQLALAGAERRTGPEAAAPFRATTSPGRALPVMLPTQPSLPVAVTHVAPVPLTLGPHPCDPPPATPGGRKAGRRLDLDAVAHRCRARASHTALTGVSESICDWDVHFWDSCNSGDAVCLVDGERFAVVIHIPLFARGGGVVQIDMLRW